MTTHDEDYKIKVVEQESDEYQEKFQQVIALLIDSLHKQQKQNEK